MSNWTRVAEEDAADLEALVGQLVELSGVLARSKIPTLRGVDVADDRDLAGQRVVARGTLTRHEVAPLPPGAPISAGRGPGVYYSLRGPSGGLARAELSSHESSSGGDVT